METKNKRESKRKIYKRESGKTGYRYKRNAYGRTQKGRGALSFENPPDRTSVNDGGDDDTHITQVLIAGSTCNLCMY